MAGPGHLASNDKVLEPAKRRGSSPIAIKRSVTREDGRQERAHPARELGHEVDFLIGRGDMRDTDKEVLFLCDKIVDDSAVGSAKEHILSRLLEIQAAQAKAAAGRIERRRAIAAKQTTSLRGGVRQTSGGDDGCDVDGATIDIDSRSELDGEVELFELDM